MNGEVAGVDLINGMWRDSKAAHLFAKLVNRYDIDFKFDFKDLALLGVVAIITSVIRS